jgi:N6-L-threonylcarbamoyladenine synthase
MILSVESSCDDSSVAVTRIEDAKLLFHKKLSQEAEHARYGGVVPELASRLHAVALPELIAQAKPYFGELRAVAVTNEPGLGVTLLEGIAAAKTLATFLKLPLIPVHHLKGHIYSLFIEKPTAFPMLVILLSGGHTMIVEVHDFHTMRILATTMDDSVGESFDKTAKMMGLGYPGGPVIERLAKAGDENRFALPVPLQNSPKIAFSLSGLKNAVRLTIESLGGAEAMREQDKRDLAASFQKTVTAHLLQKSKKIIAKHPFKDVAVVGGVGANAYIKNAFETLCAAYGKRLHTVALAYCSDNAAMIGRYALDAYAHGVRCAPDEVTMGTTRKLQPDTLL